MSNNPGIVALKFDVNYDSKKLELISAKDNGLLNGANFTAGGDLKANPYKMMWENGQITENYTDDGIIATLRFRVKDGANGSAKVEVAIEEESTFDKDLNNVAFECVAGYVSMEPEKKEAGIKVAEETAKQGENVDVNVNLTKNPGIITMCLDVDYDTSVLSLVGVDDGGIFKGSTFSAGGDLTAVPFRVMWDSSTTGSNYTDTGTLAVLHFKVLDNAKLGKTNVSVKLDSENTLNNNLKNINFTCVDGGVLVEQKEFESTTTTQTEMTTTTEVTTTQTEATTTEATTTQTELTTTTEATTMQTVDTTKYYASLDTFCEMAVKDYQQKNGNVVIKADASANHPYGYSDSSGNTKAYLGVGASYNVGSGCGILAYVNAVYYMNGSFIEPTFLADWSVNHGHRVNGKGTAYSLYKAFADAYGADYGFKYNGSSNYYSDMIEHLKAGEVAIAGAAGHIMAIVDYDSSNGKFLILDSCKSSNRHTYSTGYTWETKSSCQATPKLNFETAFYFLKSTKTILKATTLSVAPGNLSTNTEFSWNNVDGATGYTLKIWKNKIWEGEAYYNEWDSQSTSFSKLLPVGTYQAYIDTLYGDDYVMSNVVEFVIKDYKLSSPTVNVSSPILVSGETAKITWGAVDKAEGYWIDVWVNGEHPESIDLKQARSYDLKVKKAKYEIYITAYNGSVGAISDVCTFEGVDRVNLGDDFYAVILNQNPWKPIYCDENNNVVLTTELKTNYDQTLWHIIRHSDDGTYSIYSLKNGKALDVQKGTDANETNVICYDSKGTDNQRWYYELRADDSYLLRPKCAPSRALDAYNAGITDGTNIQIYYSNNSSAQQFTIYPLNAERDKLNYSISAEKTSVNLGIKVKISVGGTLPYVYNYKFHIIDPSGKETTVDNGCNPDYTLTTSSAGTYTVYAEVKSPLYTDKGSKTDRSVIITSNGSYTVTLNANGGSVSPTSIIVKYGSKYGTLPPASLDGYTFTGWFTEKTGGTQIKEDTNVTITSNQTLYAHWQINKVNVHFNANGGTIASGGDYYIGTDSYVYTTKEKKILDSIWSYNQKYKDGLYNPETFKLARTGYQFVGWSDGTKVYDPKNANVSANDLYPDIKSKSGTITLYAKWEINKVNVHFNANGGTIASGGDYYIGTDSYVYTTKEKKILDSIWSYNQGSPSNSRKST